MKVTAAGIRSETPLYFFTERYEEAYRMELASFIDAIRNGTGAECSGRDALAPLAIAMAAKRSLETGRPEQVRRAVRV